MKLLIDDINNTYVWVSAIDENDELSPHFDYEEDAFQWKARMLSELTEPTWHEP